MCYNENGDHMKRVIGLIVLVLLCGCGSKSVMCSYEIDNDQFGYHLTRNYQINYHGDYVKDVIMDEEVIADTGDMVSYFKDSNEAMYLDYKSRYRGYEYTVEVKNKKIISHIEMDYTKMDLDEYVNDNKDYKSYYVGNNNFKVTGIIKMLEDLGATCQ